MALSPLESRSPVLTPSPTSTPVPVDDGFARTRWWWIRHAPVREDGGRIYGQRDLSCDCSDARVFRALARRLPRDAVWVASHLRRTHETARAIWEAAGGEPPALEQTPELAEQDLGDWQGQDRAAFFAARTIDPQATGSRPPMSARPTARASTISRGASARRSRA